VHVARKYESLKKKGKEPDGPFPRFATDPRRGYGSMSAKVCVIVPVCDVTVSVMSVNVTLTSVGVI
jgi:hypothetical protein